MAPVENCIVSKSRRVQIARPAPNMRRGVELVDFSATSTATENVEESLVVDYRGPVYITAVFNLGLNEVTN